MDQRPSAPVLTFLGATGTVTGSRFLLETSTARVLIECGLFQGLKEYRNRNRDPFVVDPASIDAVVMTHAHLDHTGYLPALTTHGFHGPVYATRGTIALANIVLPDSGHLMEEEAEFANRKGFSKHRPAEPLYTEADARRACHRFHAVEFGVRHEVAEGIAVEFAPAGHILGSAVATVHLEASGRTITFSGDLGRPEHPLFLPPAPPPESTFLVVESTYGDRTHDRTETSLDHLRDVIVRTAKHGGTVLIPAFAVDRTEVLLYHLARMRRDGTIPDLPIAVDSPMALAALRVYRDAIVAGEPDIRPDLRATGDPFDGGHRLAVLYFEASKALDHHRGPQTILSASGMATGGRVLHHLARYLPESRNTVVLVGFQAEGTRGRRLANGERSIKMLGRYVGVSATVVDLPAMSVHADQEELLLWMAGAPAPPETTFVVHGEAPASAALRTRIQNDLGWTAAAPSYQERVRLD